MKDVFGETIRKYLVTLFLCLSGPSIVLAQEDVIKIDTDLVGFEVTVLDRHGKPVKGLGAKDFKVSEDGVERKIDFFEPLKKSGESRPVAIVFALDMSGSVTREELNSLEDALKSFISRLADYDAYFAILTFGMDVKTIQTLTNKPEKLQRSFEKLLKEEDGLSTHAYDAADQAIRILGKKTPRTLKDKLMKRSVILITDGFPVGDTVSAKTVIERANESETSIYSVLLPSYSRLQGSKNPLPTPLDVSGLIEKTGGRSFYANEKTFETLFTTLAEDITSSYVLAIYPNELARKDGKYYEVKISGPEGLTVKQNRGGYALRK